MDILIVAVLFYGIIKLVRDSRAGQLVKGLIFFIIVFLMSNLMELTMLNNLLTYFFQYAFIAVIIVFQPEIRKALEQMGRSNVGKSLVNVVSTNKESKENEAEIRNTIESIVNSFTFLQKLKMGALVVFERQTKLGEIIETGTIIDAKASSSMISNIFFNKAPLHDGAMVIRSAKIHSAGCILPLTKNDSLSDAVGTRHRAALGISEESDCIAVVLSEETGQISIAESGVLKRNFTKQELTKTLTEYLLEKDDKIVSEAKKRNIFTRKKEVKNDEV